MADLEELGYIIQPHTSAGRIPSDAGYRLYVDRMMADKKQELDDKEHELLRMQDMLLDKVDRLRRFCRMLRRHLPITPIMQHL